jgi:hypothetical protein
MSRAGSRLTLGMTLIVVGALLAIVTSSAAAKSNIFFYSNGPSTTQAGAHPNIVAAVEPGNRFSQSPKPPCECDDPKDIAFHAPQGVIANPHVISECTAAELATFSCPPDSQAGLVVLHFFGWGALPIYRTIPQAGQAGELAFLPPLGVAIPQYVAINARTGGDYGLDFTTLGINHALPPSYVANIFWGVPAAHSHDVLRFGQGERGIECSVNPLAAIAEDVIPGDCSKKPPHVSSLPSAPLTQNPTTCVGPLTSSVDLTSYDGETDHAEATWPATTGCDKLSFNPSLAAAPTTTETDSAAGLAVDIKVPQFQDPETPSPSEIRATTLTLPEGFTINPSAADSKTSCSDAQANLGNEEAAACPEFSKVGTTELNSSALPGPIFGYIYLGDPKPGDRYRAILSASGFGTSFKIAGSIHPDPATGRLVGSFENLPQAPFQEFNLHFFGSERGLFATPTRCGTYEVKTTFKPWASELSDQTSTQFFTIESGPKGRPCPNGPRPFAPTLQAGSVDNTGGAHTPFALQISREDGEQNFKGFTIQTPPGFSATLAGVPYCPETAISQLAVFGYQGLSEQASPVCPAASQIGTTTAGVGAGTHPLFVNGKAYLAGPYQGAPLSILAVIPAVAGPYDLGVVPVRVAVKVDPLTAQVTTVSDPLPQILEGIPLRTRFIELDLDRPGFALNPTNCDPFAIESMLTGIEGALSTPSANFQVANCADLAFEPKLSIRLSGSTKQAGNPSLTATFTAKPGEANISRTQVTLPRVELIDNAHIGNLCTRVQFDEGTTPGKKCPPDSILGFAEADTPLLDKPLEGPIYLRATGRPGLPDIVAALNGQIDIVLDGRVDSVHGRLRTTFETVPDAPISRVTIHLDGGRKGLLENSPKLCAHVQHFTAAITGQNGMTADQSPVLSTSCRKKPKRKPRGHHQRSHRHPARKARP